MSDTPQILPQDDDDFLAAEMALGLTTGEALIAAQGRLNRDAPFAALVAGWQERFVAMTDDIDPVKPHRRLKKTLMLQLFPKTRVPLMQRLWVWQGISFAALAMLAYLAMPMLRPAGPSISGPIYATQMVGDTGDLQVFAVLDPSRGGIALHRVAGAAPEGRVFELWAILPDAAPVSLGLVPDDTTHLKLPPAFAEVIEQLTLAISDEPPGGAPDGAPTGEIRAVGAVKEI